MIKCWEYLACKDKSCLARKHNANCWNIKLRCSHLKMFCFSKEGCTNCRYFKLMNKMDSTIGFLKNILKENGNINNGK